VRRPKKKPPTGGFLFFMLYSEVPMFNTPTAAIFFAPLISMGFIASLNNEPTGLENEPINGMDRRHLQELAMSNFGTKIARQ